MKKFIKKLFAVILLAALVLVGIRFGPNIYSRLFGGGNVQWLSERFSETLKEKNQLMVYEVETTGQETVTQDAWLIGTVQKVVMPYTFQMNFTVDLSKAKVSVNGNVIEVRVPSPVAGYQKLTVDEATMKKNDWLYPLTPERYQQIKTKVENQLFEEGKANPDYTANAWNVTVRNLENLFKSVLESENAGGGLTINVIKDDTLAAEPTVQPEPTAGEQAA